MCVMLIPRRFGLHQHMLQVMHQVTSIVILVVIVRFEQDGVTKMNVTVPAIVVNNFTLL